MNSNSRHSSDADCDRIMAAMPSSLRALAQRVGVLEVFELVRAFGGQRVFIPRAPGGRLSAHLSASFVEALIAERGGSKFDVPRAARLEALLRDDAIRADCAAGACIDELVERYGLCDRRIRRIRQCRTAPRLAA